MCYNKQTINSLMLIWIVISYYMRMWRDYDNSHHYLLLVSPCHYAVTTRRRCVLVHISYRKNEDLCRLSKLHRVCQVKTSFWRHHIACCLSPPWWHIRASHHSDDVLWSAVDINHCINEKEKNSQWTMTAIIKILKFEIMCQLHQIVYLSGQRIPWI